MSAWEATTTLGVALLQAHTGHAAAARPAFYEYLLVAIAVVAMVWTLYLAVRMTVRPGEDKPDHIKRRILEDADELAEQLEDHLGVRKSRHG